MSRPQRTLAELAGVLRRTASTHRDLAATLAEFNMLDEVVGNLLRLADSIETTAKQVERGVYGSPEPEPE